MTKNEVMQLLMWIPTFDGRIPPPAILKPTPLWTGKQILSMILPKINLEKIRAKLDANEDQYCSKKDNKIVITNGELICGIMCSKTVGKSQSGLIHICMLEKGYEETRVFMSSI